MVPWPTLVRVACIPPNFTADWVEAQVRAALIRYRDNGPDHLPLSRVNAKVILEHEELPEISRLIASRLHAGDVFRFIGAGLYKAVFDKGDGKVLRIVRAHQPDQPDFADYLSPTWMKATNDFDVEEMPLAARVTPREFAFLRRRVARNGIEWGDASESGAGRLANGRLVVLDGNFDRLPGHEPFGRIHLYRLSESNTGYRLVAEKTEGPYSRWLEYSPPHGAWLAAPQHSRFFSALEWRKDFVLEPFPDGFPVVSPSLELFERCPSVLSTIQTRSLNGPRDPKW
jgi:hypothetical protein